MSSLHDSEILAYLVDLKNGNIEMKTLAESGKEINIKFTDVLAHEFSTHLKGSIILDLETRNIETFIIDNRELLDREKDYCWPVVYRNIDDFEKKLLKEDYKYYVLYASYGLSGWIVAKEISVDY